MEGAMVEANNTSDSLRLRLKSDKSKFDRNADNLSAGRKHQTFIERLEQASKDKALLVKLANDVVCESHDHRTFSQRKDLIKNADTLCINAAYALTKMRSPDFSTNDRLYMIMNRYVGIATKENPKLSRSKALDGFIKEFAASYPQAYGSRQQEAENTSQKQLNPLLLQAARNGSVHTG